jgi:hypothetical protein
MADADRANWLVLTTINEPNDGLGELITRLGTAWGVVVVGDVGTPRSWANWPVEFLSLERQRELFGAFAADARTQHYARKNFGYLYAGARGATALVEIDDDGRPLATFAAAPTRAVRGRLVGGGGWANIYRWFTDRLIWPRGLPLDAVQQRGALRADHASGDCPVQQFLVDDDPDVDAIYRQLFPNTGFAFDADAAAVILEPGTWCPFNSQNTLWFADAFPLLYLPQYCNFRVTDIWRSLVVQRALWLLGGSLAFHTSTVRQTRNPHDLTRDFIDEIPVYTQVRAVAECLDRSADRLAGRGVVDIGRGLWLSLTAAGLLPDEEVVSIERWFDAVATLRRPTTPGDDRQRS